MRCFTQTAVFKTIISEMILQNDMHSGTPAMRLPSTEQTAVCGSIQTKEVFPVSAEM